MTGERAVFGGYASVFNRQDMNGDIVRPGAFRKNLVPGGASTVRMLYQHKAEEPLGRWLEIYEDAYGLFASGELALSNSRARDVWALIRAGALDGLSIGFRTGKARSLKGRQKTGREILEIDLWEISLVTFPMAQAARITRIGQDANNPKSMPITMRLRQATRTMINEKEHGVR